MTDYECNMTLNISIPSYIGANGLNSLNMLGLSSPMNATVHQSDAPSPSISLLFSVTKIEQIGSTNKIYRLSECLHEMFQYYVDIHKEKKKRDDVIDADEVSSSSDNNLAQTDAASVMGEEDNDDGPTPFIQHPNQSRFYPGNVVLNLVNGSDRPWGDNPRVGGSENSQVRGSSVMVFSRGRPMTLTLRYATPDRDVTQNRKYYVTSPSFQMRMEDGWITILDAVDDMLMVHEVDWDDDDGCETDVRFAWVYRWLGVTHDYYVQGCTVRRTREMMNTVVRPANESNSYLDREMV